MQPTPQPLQAPGAPRQAGPRPSATGDSWHWMLPTAAAVLLAGLALRLLLAALTRD